MTSNESKTFFDSSLPDRAQPYFCKVTSQDSQDRIVSLREKCLSIIQTDSKLVERLFRDYDGLSLIRSNPKFLHNLHLDIKAKFVDKEDFYKDEVKSMASGKGEHSAVANYGHSWKRMYLEEKITNLLQDAEVDDATLLVLIESFQDYIFTLQLQNFSNLSLLQNILPSLTNLTSLELEYGHKLSTHISLKSMQHQQKGSTLFGGMQISDAQSLARALNSLPHLCSLSLANSQINDKVLCAFFQELQSSHTPGSCHLRDSLIELDLSFNKIHPNGFHRILEYFFPLSSLEDEYKDDPNHHHHPQKQEGNGEDCKNCGILITFKLAGNEIGIDGAKILARMLETNTSLQDLDVRMNDLKDDGGQLVLEGLHHNHTLKKLNMACNELSTKTANCLCSFMNQQGNDGQHSILEVLDVSCNMFVESDFTNILASTVSKSSDSNNLIELDLRGDYDSIIARDSMSAIEAAMMSKRRVAKRGKHCHF